MNINFFNSTTTCNNALFWRLRILLFLFFLGSLTAVTACSGIDGTGAGTILITPKPISFTQVAPGETGRVAVSLSNTSKSPLIVYGLSIEGRKETDPDGHTSVGSAAGLHLEGVTSGEFKVEPFGKIDFSVVYQPKPSTPEPRAQLVIQSSDPRFPKEDPMKVDIYTIETAAEIEVTPELIRFSKIPPGRSVTRRLSIRNRGTRDLVLSKMPEIGTGQDYKIGSTSFGGATESAKKFPVILKPYDDNAARQHPELYQFDVDVVYSPTGNVGDDLSSGEVVIFHKSAGRSKDERKEVPIKTSLSGPMIFAYPLTRDFGQVPLGRTGNNGLVISNNGTEDLVIQDISITKNSPENEFSLKPLTFPITIAPDSQSPPIFLHYSPREEGIDTGQLLVKSNDPLQPALAFDLIGRGADGVCPVVNVGGYVEGVSTTPAASVNAKPLDYVVLDASKSADSDGEIRRWEWHVVKKPIGASSALEPLKSDTSNSDFSRRRYRPLVAGDYEISLDVYDNEGFSGCSVGRVKISVAPSKKIHIELTWTNPLDPDETDNVGADVDLHMVKIGGNELPDGPGRWFTAPYDIYFRNKSVFWNPEKPTLDIDDQDGAGPENIQLDNPVTCGWYAVGVDYFKQIYGTAYVTVRIYINQALVFEQANLPLDKQEAFYDIARIRWDGTTGTIYDVSQRLTSRPQGKIPSTIPEMSLPCSAAP